MLEALRARQRPRLQSEGVHSWSFLPRRPAGTPLFTPFGNLVRCLETVQSPGLRILRRTFAGQDLILVILNGTLHVGESGSEGRPFQGPAALAASPEERLLALESRGEQPVRYLDLVLEQPASAPAVPQLEPKPPGTPDPPDSLTHIQIPMGPPYHKIVPLVSGLGHEDCMLLPHASAVHFGRLRAGESLIFETSALRRAMLVVTHGLVQSGKFRLLEGDWLMAQGESELTVAAVRAARFVLVDLP